MTAKLDIIVLGSTGFTGRLACRYLARKAEVAGRWGIAGRSEAKLAALKAELGIDVPTFVADADQPATVDAVCAKAACVIACAGPFTRVGMPVVEACVRHGTHYVDSTGEIAFVRRAIAAHHAEAARKGVVIVPCCGFDCVPADLGNYVVHREAPEPVTVVRGYFQGNPAGVSNGTMNSVACVMDAMSTEDMSPLALVPETGVQPTGAPTRYGVWYENGRFTGFFLAAAGDERLVRRTNSLMGTSAVYVEAMQGSLAQVVRLTLATYAIFMAVMIAPVRRWLIAKYFTGTGIGPTDEAMAKSDFRCDFVGETVSGRRVETTMIAKEDAYTATALFLGECALSALTLARRGTLKGGVLTPAYAFGDELVRRSREAGVEIDTVIIGGSGGSVADEAKKVR
ncbi:Saccharopine dehydrogenase [Novymonas esmeraldas]|uniref:Saccharopine dehydrogenase n=1 Tax=Novymonas esmeraldas TaxID=1808958 RepID=A0AAW0F6W6_9TRYP